MNDLTSPSDDPGEDVDVLDDAYEVMLLAKNGLNTQTNTQNKSKKKKNK